MAKRTAKKSTRRKATAKKPIQPYDHPDKKRANNPPVGLVTPYTDPDKGKKKTCHRDPHLDPRTIIEAARRRNGDGGNAGKGPWRACEEQSDARYAETK